MNSTARQAFERVAGARVTSTIAGAASAAHVRILAYHDVPDSSRFTSHVREIVRSGVPITGRQFVAAQTMGAELPKRSVWVTFDDGDPSVVRRALPVLEQFGVPATLFVCPGMVSTREGAWWDTVIEAWRRGLRPAAWEGPRPCDGSEAVRFLKRVPDEHRRATVSELAERLRASGVQQWGPGQLALDELQRWTVAGMQLGNHTWDHPCLDQCDAATQRWQIGRAQQWLEEEGLSKDRIFAYPDGVRTEAAEDYLREAGFDVGLLHDHHLARPSHPPFRVSRLRVDAKASPVRLRAILSGTHSASYRAVDWLRSHGRSSGR